ncbi:MAG TPA: thioredoxin-dependent thiol peroxidase [Bacteroidia bacterium]|jgi:peroxiredoxin Q/BCP
MINHITGLKKGDKAPVFKGKDQDGNTVSIEDFEGKKLILYFYPQDNTPTCTNEACNLRDNFSALKKKGFAIIGVSPDNEKKHRKFIDKFDLPFPLIADTEMKIIKDYDVWGQKKFMGRVYDGLVRTTFVINEKGIIELVITKVDSKNHTEQILKELTRVE